MNKRGVKRSFTELVLSEILHFVQNGSGGFTMTRGEGFKTFWLPVSSLC